MRRIYHIVSRRAWEAGGKGPYRAGSLATEGFIHCSNREQVARVANLFYAEADDLLVLEIDVGRLGARVRDENAPNGERFPHIYGPIERDAVVAVEHLRRDENGRWVLPEPATVDAAANA